MREPLTVCSATIQQYPKRNMHQDKTKRRNSVVMMQEQRLMAVLVCLFVAVEQIDCMEPSRVAYSHQYPVAGRPIAPSPQLLLHPHQCPTGAPLQWRPHLDAPSKAYLAPAVVLASLKEFSLSPIQLATPSQLTKQAPGHQQQQQQQQAYHPQDINNAGVNIYATFSTLSVLKSRLNISSTIRVVYRVSASLSTTTDLMQLAKSNTLSPASSLTTTTTATNSATNGRFNLQMQVGPQRPQQQHVSNQFVMTTTSQQPICSLELSEHELDKKVNRLFKKNQNYILFLDQLNHQKHHHQQPAAASHYIYQQQQSFYFPFATHEPLNNQTSRALRRTLCKNCAQVPQVQLLNSTFVSSTATATMHDQTTAATSATTSTMRPKVKLDCRVSGFPVPWIQWFRNGKLLRNKPGRFSMRVGKWKKRHNMRWSRLEIELGQKNETGIYECRAMNVVAREPAVGAYTLLVHPGYYALIPMQQPLDQSAQELTEATSITGPTSGTGGRSSPVAAGNSNSSSSSSNNNNNNNNSQGETHSATTSSIAATTTQRPTTTASASVAATTTTTIPPISTTTTSTTPTTTASDTAAQIEQQQESSADGGDSNGEENSGNSNKTAQSKKQQQQQQQQHQPVVGQSCPPGIHDTYCMNKGTCVLIGHIDEFYCNCPEGYEGHRCESKSFGHKKAPH